MSRTYRNLRHQMKLGDGKLGRKRYKRGKVRDGTPQYCSISCEHHGGCPWCEGNRLHGTERRKPIVEEQYDN